jgi:hypothetical protein
LWQPTPTSGEVERKNGRRIVTSAIGPYLCKSTTEILRHQASRPRWKRRANPIGPYVPTDVACSRNRVVVSQESNVFAKADRTALGTAAYGKDLEGAHTGVQVEL